MHFDWSVMVIPIVVQRCERFPGLPWNMQLSGGIQAMEASVMVLTVFTACNY
jgi:hypothetical protein